MALTVPLQAAPNQTLLAALGDQLCQINVYQRGAWLFLDLFVNNVLVVGGVICENLNRIVRDAYFGFAGDLCFLDTQGSNNPTYAGLGASGRYQLVYLTAADLAAGVASAG